MNEIKVHDVKKHTEQINKKEIDNRKKDSVFGYCLPLLSGMFFL